MNTNEYEKQIGARLLLFRTQAGLTVEDVATLLSTSPARYIKLESGEHIARKDEELQVDDVIILCNHYQISIGDFLGPMQGPNFEGLLNGLTSKDKEIISDIIKKNFK